MIETLYDAVTVMKALALIPVLGVIGLGAAVFLVGMIRELLR